jgi:murein DD-endopeptidase MepM/ murein hydrolase activator NlpD
VRRMADAGLRRTPTQVAEAELEPWEREALQAGAVGLPEGHDPAGVDAIPVSRGVPDDYCITLGAGEADGDETEPYCVLDPLSDPRFAPVHRGVPASALPSNSTWPVLTSHSGRLVVSYWTAAGVRGYSGRAFAAKRTDDDGPRKHAGIDLFANDGDTVVAPEDGRVLAILPFNAGTWAVYVRSMLDDRVVNLGEVEKFSWREFGVKPGQPVQVGQPLARIGVQTKGSTMLHFETYGVEGVDDETIIAAIRAGELSWPADAAAPRWLRDPTGYLLTAAKRTYQRESLGIG